MISVYIFSTVLFSTVEKFILLMYLIYNKNWFVFKWRVAFYTNWAMRREDLGLKFTRNSAVVMIIREICLMRKLLKKPNGNHTVEPILDKEFWCLSISVRMLLCIFVIRWLHKSDRFWIRIFWSAFSFTPTLPAPLLWTHFEIKSPCVEFMDIRPSETVYKIAFVLFSELSKFIKWVERFHDLQEFKSRPLFSDYPEK